MPIADIKFSRKKLTNGLELVLAPMPKNPTITAIILFKIGSRYETDKFSGISHFLEHIVFKGNQLYRTPQELAAAIDALGGSFNAFTTKEFTGFYIKVGAEYSDIALKWLGALVTTPLIKSPDIEMERNVILQEINMYNDTPMAQIGNYFEELVFPGSALGRNVIGTKKSLAGIKRKELTSYFDSHYFPGNAVLVIAGDLGKVIQNKAVDKINQYFKFSNKSPKKVADDPYNHGVKIKKVKAVFKKTDQTHLMLGVKTFSYLDKRRYPLSVIAAVMGGGMSSWAFSEIREKRGLAYYVRSMADLYQDAGSYFVSAGLDNSKLELAVKEIMKLYRRISEKPVSPRELKKAKDHLIGGMALERETSDSIATILGSEIASRGAVTPFSKEVKIVKSISSSEIRKLAQEFFQPERQQLAMIGPWKKKDEEKFAKWLK
jgi:predicted Zn-dependent peptidase